MKRILLLLVTLSASFTFALQTSARGVIIYSNGEELKITQPLPKDFGSEDGEHLNFGIHYKSFSIFWLPLWNYGEYKYAIINDAEDTWEELTLNDAKSLGKKYGFEVPDKPTLPLLTQIGLKPLIILIILLGIYGQFFGKKKEEETKGETTTPPTQE